MAFPSIEIEVDQLAEFLFKLNTSNAVAELSLGGIEDNKDLFYFCHDLFCKGLVMLFGNESKVIINDLTTEQFQAVKQKMANAGINITLDVVTSDNIINTDADNVTSSDGPCDLPQTVLYPSINIQDIELMPSNLDLNAYKFKVHLSPNLTYVISYNLFHKVA